MISLTKLVFEMKDCMKYIVPSQFNIILYYIVVVVLAYEDYIPANDTLKLSWKFSLKCIPIKIVRNGIASGSVSKIFSLKIRYEIFRHEANGNIDTKETYISIQNTDCKFASQ